MSFAEDLKALEAIRDQLQSGCAASVEDLERIALRTRAITDRARSRLRQTRETYVNRPGNPPLNSPNKEASH